MFGSVHPSAHLFVFSCLLTCDLGCPARTKIWSSTFSFFLELFRPRANFGAKEKVELQTFVLEGHPNVTITSPRFFSVCNHEAFQQAMHMDLFSIFSLY